MTSDGPTSRRDRVWAMLRDASGPLSIVAVAAELGVHPNTARFHLEGLARSGRAERLTSSTTGRGRPASLFRARRAMDPGGPRSYQLLAGVLLSSLAADPAAAGRAGESGRDWGRQLAEGSAGDGPEDATDRLARILADLGFAPERRTERGEQQIGLRHCPFLELADMNAEVVCPVHLGLMQGAMESLSDELTVRSLDPFVQPDLCLAHLGTREKEDRP